MNQAQELLVTTEDGTQKALRVARFLLDIAAFVGLTPALSFAVFAFVVGALATIAIAMAWLLHHLGVTALDGFSAWLLRAPQESPIILPFLVGLPLGTVALAGVFAVARSGKLWAALLLLFIAPFLLWAAYLFVTALSPYGAGAGATIAIGIITLLGALVMGAPILAAIAALLMLAVFVFARSPLARARRQWPAFSIPMFVARHAAGGRVWLSLLMSVMRMMVAAILAAVAFLILAAAAVWSAAFVAQRVHFDLENENYQIFGAMFWCALIYFVLFAESIVGLWRRTGVAFIHVICLIGGGYVFCECVSYILHMIARPNAVPPVVFSEITIPLAIASPFIVRGFIGAAMQRSIDHIRATASRTARALSAMRPEAPILFLRSFSDDEQAVRTDAILAHAMGVSRSRMRMEEIVAGIMFARGPLVALANPALRTTPIGAARDAMPHDNWHQAVLDYLAAAQIVVCFFGRTPSFLWETDQIIQAGKDKKMILILPPQPDGRLLSRDAPRLAARLGLQTEEAEQTLLKDALVIAYDPAVARFRAFVSRRRDAFAYEQALLSAATGLSQP